MTGQIILGLHCNSPLFKWLVSNEWGHSAVWRWSWLLTETKKGLLLKSEKQTNKTPPHPQVGLLPLKLGSSTRGLGAWGFTLPVWGSRPQVPPISTGTTAALTFHIFSTSFFSSWYFSSFFLMLLSLGIATSIPAAFFFHLSITMIVSHHLFISLYLEVPQGLSSVYP